ncbi:MAG: hypothetical protein F6J90_37230 [Moorea sp. SIOASIH]|uniref:hypothetical protein n=1 Tax=Moorena sp. SIOASIH TaxID=2607817 RepID=UPI0013BCD1D0|nr:hypothetical protein [Moorena sp. SIOASIH]NEO41665.1 hypothetical protein [Moorena sp. SIOASIH]
MTATELIQKMWVAHGFIPILVITAIDNDGVISAFRVRDVNLEGIFLLSNKNPDIFHLLGGVRGGLLLPFASCLLPFPARSVFTTQIQML